MFLQSEAAAVFHLNTSIVDEPTLKTCLSLVTLNISVCTNMLDNSCFFVRPAHTEQRQPSFGDICLADGLELKLKLVSLLYFALYYLLRDELGYFTATFSTLITS